MSVWIPINGSPDEKIKFTLAFDEQGHVHLISPDGAQHRLDYDRHNNLCSYQLTQKLKELHHPTIHTMTPTDVQSLKHVTQVKIQEEDGSDSEEEEEDDDHYPEDQQYQMDPLSEDEELQGFFGTELDQLSDVRYEFSRMAGSDIHPQMYLSPCEETLCSFETLVYQNHKLQFKTHLLHNAASFRLQLHLEGRFSFRPVGSPDVDYVVSVGPDKQLLFHIV